MPSPSPAERVDPPSQPPTPTHSVPRTPKTLRRTQNATLGIYLDDDLGPVALAGAPQNQRERREEQEEQQDEAGVEPRAAPCRGGGAPAALLILLVRVPVVVVGLLAAVELPPRAAVEVAGVGVLEGGGEAGGGGLAGVVDGGAVVVGVGRGPRGAGPVGHLLGVVVGGALDVVEGPARGPRRRRRGVDARHLRVRLGVDCERHGGRRGGGGRAEPEREGGREEKGFRGAGLRVRSERESRKKVMDLVFFFFWREG